jgi:ppGpp synthetase/RelA/SpoT-type nucleotidyltranferase
VVTQVTLPASKTRINRAGEALGRAVLDGADPMSASYREELELVRAYRAAHAYPLTAVTMALRHHAKRAADGSWFDIGQRLKQLSTITDKLARIPGMNLARMQDIGGCRATFLDQATVDAAIASILNRAKRGTWEIVDVDDYVTERQRSDGYRAKHVIAHRGSKLQPPTNS